MSDESDVDEPRAGSENGDARRQKKERHTNDFYLAYGAFTDCQSLLTKFNDMKTSTFEDFARLWKEMHFSDIFCGRDTFAEMLEFVEELMAICKEFILPPHNQIKRIGALYLMYGIYTQQPTNGLLKFRITPPEWSAILKFVDALKAHGYIDANYIFHKMCMDGAFVTVASEREYGLERNIRKYLSPWAARDAERYPADQVFSAETFVNRICKNSLMSALKEKADAYSKLKANLAGLSHETCSFEPVAGADMDVEDMLKGSADAISAEIEPEAVTSRRAVRKKAFLTRSQDPAFLNSSEATTSTAERLEDDPDDPPSAAGKGRRRKKKKGKKKRKAKSS